ncbi:MAG: large conductance mechanosensitive channel protein MscL [Chloroflexi bacterium]|nr:large conductance mechanosensitive channel protein MscL [Chloroflexota bacterium]
MFKDYRRFISRGNVIDLAVAFALGAAFTVIVKSLVTDILMPPITFLIGDTALVDNFVTLKDGGEAGPYATLAAARQAGAVTLNYGLFIDGIVAFLIVGFAMFIIVRYMKRVQDRFDEAEVTVVPTTKHCPFCLTTINVVATRCAFCTSELSVEPA